MPLKMLARPIMPMQRGPTCGLYALAAAAKAINPVLYKPLKPTADEGDVSEADAASLDWRKDSLRAIAKRMKVKGQSVTAIGEVFDSDGMVALAKHIGLKAETNTDTSRAGIVAFTEAALNADRYVLAPFGVSHAAEGMRFDGQGAHWCVLYGTGQPSGPGSHWWMAEHWGKTHEFKVERFVDSSRALARFDKTYAKRVPPALAKQNLSWTDWQTILDAYARARVPVDPKAFRRAEFSADLPTTLAGRFVSVGP